jgi:ATP-dependent exoDNAse (exonuclease V) alpha subunit
MPSGKVSSTTTRRRERGRDLAWEAVLAPANAPSWATNRGELWNRAEAAERRRDAQIGKSFVLALPKELTVQENAALITEWVNERFVSRGYCADIAIHLPRRGENVHAHCTIVERKLEADGFARLKERGTYRSKALTDLRRAWAEIANDHLTMAGHRPTLDHRSYRERGIDRLKQIPMGKSATALERRGIRLGSVLRTPDARL